MLLGATFLSLANGLDESSRERALRMLTNFSESDTFSPLERQILRTMRQMADDVFPQATAPKAVAAPRPKLRLVANNEPQSAA